MAFCSNCGNKLDDGAKFCPKCGTPIDGKGDVPQSDDNGKSDEDAKNTKVGCISLIVIILIIGYFVNKCTGDDLKATDDSNAPQATEQVASETQDAEEQARKQQEEEERLKKEKEAAEAKERDAFVGDYVYSYFYGNTNVNVYFKISLKSDGTFTHEPNNEQTKGIVDMETVVDGKDYPSGGKWEVKDTSEGKAAFLDFEGSWGDGSITPDKSIIQIDNMNGLRLKAPIHSL
jgi:hypothetical protein